MLKEKVRADFMEWSKLNRHKYPDGMIDSLVRNERFPTFIERLTQDLHKASTRRADFSRDKIKKVVYVMSELFAKLAKQHRDEYYMSEIEKHRVKAETTRYDDLKQDLKDEGIYEEQDRSTELEGDGSKSS